MNTFSLLITPKIGEARGVPRIWLEGQKLLNAGIEIGSCFSLSRGDGKTKLELVPADTSEENNSGIIRVSKRVRNGVTTPLIEIRTALLRSLFKTAEKVRVVIRLGRILITALDKDKRIDERLARLKQKLSAREPLAVCSLFHGGGVLDRAIHAGLARSGIDTYVRIGIELEEQYLDASLRNNRMLWRDNSIAICADIRDVQRGDGTPRCDLVIAGIPCTGASRAGKAKNKLSAAEQHPSAGSLFVDFLDFVRHTNPVMAIIENVPDYLTSTSMDVIRSVLASLGYKLFECILDGNVFGAFENRSRMTLVAYTEGAIDTLTQNQILPLRTKEGSLRDLMEDVPEHDESWKSYDYLEQKEVRDIATGKGFRRQILTPEATSCGCIGRGYAKARSTEPFIRHPTNFSLSRLLTVIEHATAKTIPVEIVSGVSNTTAHEILGQSVIYAAFESVAAAIGQMIRLKHRQSFLMVA
ncbi:DNA cytosine methyltransferase [Pseudomonas quasicaspiana]|uniref:DNA cytosine methyltransferase n=1 Tax=Pseudomonas quasicaspiana TaxID=2829821 RepID=UPI001E53F332|nr:DNA cytosine methyltransferase [Pseudomonas quasicaspiana]MCD5972331.1 DNA cytosine methyltransferase [Pseudomonas quasicaspiana]